MGIQTPGGHAASATNYPLNCWWVAALSDEVGDSLLSRWLLDRPIVFYRKSDGTVAALEDRCAHRQAPLSMGKREGDAIVCGYHGFAYGPDGRGLRVPSQDSVPRRLCVRAFPTFERAPFVWIWLGDEGALAQMPEPPRLEWTDDPDFAQISGYMHMAANYMVVKENVIDLSHFTFVHATSFQMGDWTGAAEVEVQGDFVTFRNDHHDIPVPPWVVGAANLAPDSRMNRAQVGSFVSPALQVSTHGMDVIGDRLYRYHAVHATTPQSPTAMHYFWLLGRNFGQTPAEMEQWRAFTLRGFAEDEAIILGVQDRMNNYPLPPRGEVSVASDAPTMQTRAAVDRWLARERKSASLPEQL